MREIRDTLLFVIVSSVCVLVSQSDAARILAVFPFPSISHQVVFRPLTHELARRGHEVTVITTDPAFPKGKSPANLTEIDLHDMSYDIWTKAIIKLSKEKTDILSQLHVILGAMTGISETQFKSPEIQKFLKEERHFDLVFVEACMKPALIFSHFYKAPAIVISSFGSMLYNNAVMGAPTHPLLFPTAINQRIYNLTMWDKLEELFKYFRILLFIEEPQIERDDAMLQRVFGPNIPTVHELGNNVDMLFLNSHRIWEGNFPVPPSIVHIGGIHEKEKKNLPEDIQSYLDSSKNGVIYMSFGTNFLPSTLPAEKIKSFVRVFSELPYDILLKWDKDVLPGQTPNIRIGKWFPQSDLLMHPKVKLFITQGGLQSTEESIAAGVPLIGVPMQTDQWYNAEKYVHFKIGKKLDIGTLSEEDFKNAIETILRDDRFRENVIKLRTLLRDQPESALERAIWWTEHVLRHGNAKHLRAPAANMSWAEYYEVKLVATVLLTIIAAILIVCFAIRHVLKHVPVKTLSSKLKAN